MINEVIEYTTDEPKKVDLFRVLDDYELSRERIMKVMEDTRANIDSLTMLSDQSQGVKYYEILGRHQQIMLEASRDLIDLNSKIANLTDVIEATNPTSHTPEGGFHGTTAALSKIMMDIISRERKKDAMLLEAKKIINE